MVKDFVVNGKRYWYMETYRYPGVKESLLDEYYDTFDRLPVWGYPYRNAHPGLGKVKAWLKKQSL